MPTSTFSVGLVALAGALTLTACGGSDAPSPGAAGATPPAASQDAGLDPAQCSDPGFLNAHKAFCEGHAPVLTGPATAPITLPDDIQVQIVSATSGAADPAIYDSDPTENTLATITTEITNRSNATFSFPAEKSSVRASLLYGVNRYKATGWAVSNGGASDLPGQLVAGTSAKMTSKFTLRKEGLDSVVFQFSPNGDTAADATFTDVQKLFR